MPVEDTVTTVSTSQAESPASASARSPASTNRSCAPSRYAAVRSGQPRGCVYHSIGRTAWRFMMPVVSNTFAKRSNSP
jgi:hypothetical protein